MCVRLIITIVTRIVKLRERGSVFVLRCLRVSHARCVVFTMANFRFYARPLVPNKHRIDVIRAVTHNI